MGHFYRHLYPQVYDWDNLLLAWRKARKGKRGQPPAALFEQNAGENLLALQADHLIRADIELASLRKALLLCLQLELLTPNQYRHASEMTAEVGRLLGAWRKPPS